MLFRSWITHSIETAQKKVEAHNFEIRKDLLKYDDVMNRQREAIYKQRREILEKDSVKEEVIQMIEDVIDNNINNYISKDYNLGALAHWFKSKFDAPVELKELESVDIQEIGGFLKQKAKNIYETKENEGGSDQMRAMEKLVSLSAIDSLWKEHLLVMDTLKEGIHLRGYAQVDPLVEYQKESYLAFSQMIDAIKEQVVELVFRARIFAPRQIKTVFSQTPKSFVHSGYSSLAAPADEAQNSSLTRVKVQKVGRNEPCPCGSGKKYKKCCGR